MGFACTIRCGITAAATDWSAAVFLRIIVLSMIIDNLAPLTQSQMRA